MDKIKKISLIDGSGFIFRAYYALPPLTSKNGVPVGAVLGFCNMLLKLIQEKESDKLIVIFDSAKKTFRNNFPKLHEIFTGSILVIFNYSISLFLFFVNIFKTFSLIAIS